MFPSLASVTRLSGRGRSSVESQKSTACAATSSSDQVGASSVSPGFSPRNIGAWRLADHLDVAQREVVVGRAEVEVVDPERLLEDGRVRFLARAPAPPGCCGTCSCARPDRSRWRGRGVGVARGGEQQLGAVRRAAGDDDDVGSERLVVSPSRSTFTPVTVGPGALVCSLVAWAFVSSVTLGCASAGRTAITSASDFACTRHGKPSQFDAACAGAEGRVRLVEQHAARRVERVEPGALQSSDSCWMRGSCETAGIG